MSKFVNRLPALILGLIFIIQPLRAQPAAPPAASPSIIIPGIEFYQPVSFKDILNIQVFKASDGTLVLAPAAVNVRQDEVRVIYRRHGKKFAGLLEFTFRPALSTELSDEAVVRVVKAEYPNAKIVYVAPRLVLLEGSINQKRFVLSSFSTTLLLGQVTKAEMPIDADSLEFFLSARATGAVLGRVSLVYTIRGYELDLDGKPAVTDRRVTIGGFINGACASLPRNYVDTNSGRIGCITPIDFTREEIFEIQKHLKEAGLLKGIPDGVVGPDTRRAVVAAQRRLDLLPSGRLDFNVRKAILSGALKQVPSSIHVSDGGNL